VLKWLYSEDYGFGGETAEGEMQHENSQVCSAFIRFLEMPHHAGYENPILSSDLKLHYSE
jgi:hypothetical protein